MLSNNASSGNKNRLMRAIDIERKITMEKKDLEQRVNEAVRDADLHPEEIPSIDLYLDQITSLVADKVQKGSDHFSDRILTKTMINNYSKDGLISPIKGKKYTKEQILQMLVVYSLKNTLSIGEIKRILQNVYRSPQYSEKELEQNYMRFLRVKEAERTKAYPLIQEYIRLGNFKIEEDSDFFVFLLGLSCMSSYLKDIVQELLIARYPDIAAEKTKEEQEKKEEAKRQKEEKKEEKKESKKAAKAKSSAAEADAPEKEKEA